MSSPSRATLPSTLAPGTTSCMRFRLLMKVLFPHSRRANKGCDPVLGYLHVNLGEGLEGAVVHVEIHYLYYGLVLLRTAHVAPLRSSVLSTLWGGQRAQLMPLRRLFATPGSLFSPSSIYNAKHRELELC